MKLTRIFIVAIFIAYWLLTFIYAGPSNYIKISLQEPLSVFGKLLYQKWTFFAPPPQSNHRLYYSFYTKDSTQIASYEALEFLSQQKKENVPFNTKEEAVDYMVNGSLTGIINAIVSQREFYEQKYPDSSSMYNNALAKSKIIEISNQVSAHKVLVDYGRIIARKNMDNQKIKQIHYVMFSIREIKLPKFVNREMLTKPSDRIVQGILFDSAMILFNEN
ncbi:hypothetical protein [Ascidiimonas sp. W6]|uniref:hypothetical protein n=1 Tax=Ascidiimonas meishanensis TaxID=3128903 RepID=UPI0030EEF9C6